jgi:hypothetical protein
MFRPLSLRQYKLAGCRLAFLLAGITLFLSRPLASAEAQCHRVRGFYEEHAAAAASCPSPVGLCIEGEFAGTIKGRFTSTATALQSSTDTPTTAVVWFTGDGVIHARVNGKRGDILFKSAGAYQTTGDGNIVDLQSITAGTGELIGMTGVIRASGTFNPATGQGESEYEGTVCLP